MATALYAAPMGSPIFHGFNPSTGAPLVGGTVNIFQSGSATPDSVYPTYADALAGTNSLGSVVTLNAQGEAQIWFQAGRSYKVVLKDASAVTVWTVDAWNPAGGFAFPIATEWLNYSATIAFVGGTQFKTTGVDTTATFHVGRRVKTTNSGGTVYGSVSAVAFAAGDTTVTIVPDSGALDAGLSAVAYGINSYTNPSYLDPRTCLSVLKNGNQTGFGAASKLTTWTVETDALGEWDAVNNRWTAKYPGKYRVTATMEVSDTGASVSLLMEVRNQASTKLASSQNYSHPTAGNHTTITCSRDVVIAATGNYLELYLTGSANTTAYGNNPTNVSIERIP
jgi:hypothetical protein